MVDQIYIEVMKGVVLFIVLLNTLYLRMKNFHFYYQLTIKMNTTKDKYICKYDEKKMSYCFNTTASS